MTIPDQLRHNPVLPILNLADQETALHVVEALIAGGIKALEITLRTPAALDALRAVRKEFRELTLGAGTILDKEQIKKVFDSGIDFGVSPGWDDDIWIQAQSLGFHLFPGILTPTELTRAQKAGCRSLKVFPIEPVGGINYLKSLIAPFRSLGMKYLPTGGISKGNVAPYLAEETVLAVGGSWMAPPALIEKKDFRAITELAKESFCLGNQLP